MITTHNPYQYHYAPVVDTFRSSQKNRFLRAGILPTINNAENSGITLVFAKDGTCLRNTEQVKLKSKAVRKLVDLIDADVLLAWRLLFPKRWKGLVELHRTGLEDKTKVWLSTLQKEEIAGTYVLIQNAYSPKDINQGKDYRLLRAFLMAAGVFSKPATSEAALVLLCALFTKKPTVSDINHALASFHPLATPAPTVVEPETDELGEWTTTIADGALAEIDKEFHVWPKDTNGEVIDWKVRIREIIIKQITG